MIKAADFQFLGYTGFVSVIPPDAPLSPASNIAPAARGKSPGMKYRTGLWGGYDWRHTDRHPDDIDRDGASVGLRADQFPAIDIDITHESLAQAVANVVERVLPTGPMRVGRWPKRLYMFRRPDHELPFSRLQLHIRMGEERHLVEILGAGQQYVVAGPHATTRQPYEWRVPPVEAQRLPILTLDLARMVMDAIAAELDMLGIECERVGNGSAAAVASPASQEELKAADLDLLADAVRAIPNSYPSREEYIRIGYAIKAAAQDDPARGLEIYQEFASRWTAGYNDPGVVEADWGRMSPPYVVGNSFLLDLAQQHGFNVAAREFEPVLPAEPLPERQSVDARYSDMWLSDMFIRRYGANLRYVSAWGQWLVWDRVSWVRDVSAVPGLITGLCVEVANQLMREGATNAERRANEKLAKQIASSRTYDAVAKLARVDGRVTATAESFDSQPDLIATPAGVYDLRTGDRLEPDPTQLLIKRTLVSPANTPAPLWRAFLREATGGNLALEHYLQRMIGYCLTGHTREQVLFFVHGPGGRGKGTFLNTVAHVLGELATTAQMTTFTSSHNERHPTELAKLAGSRLVQAQETQRGRKWDEQRIKSLTGGDPITARFLFRDEFTYEPTFKLVFSGNYRPHVDSLDAAMRRRIQIIPFETEPKLKNNALQEEMRRSELPAILWWALEGAVMWYRDGLNPPPAVLAATEDYFTAEDALGRWFEDCCTASSDPQSKTRVLDLYESWGKWCQIEGEDHGTIKRFSEDLAARGFRKRKSNGQMVYSGLMLNSQIAMTVN